jgi:hypothetical protein
MQIRHKRLVGKSDPRDDHEQDAFKGPVIVSSYSSNFTSISSLSCRMSRMVLRTPNMRLLVARLPPRHAKSNRLPVSSWYAVSVPVGSRPQQWRSLIGVSIC